MASAYYNDGLNGLGTAEIDLDTGNIKAVLLRTATFVATHKFLSEIITAGAVEVSRTASLASKTVGTPGPGVFDAADTLWSAVTTGAACNAFVIVQTNVTGGADGANSATRLISYHDDYTGLPVTPNGANINLAFPNDANRIFKW